MSDYNRPFIEDGSQFGISKTTFKEMEEDEQREWMVQWFLQNFEDPNNETPRDSETKEYMYLWGGPFDASEQLWDKFSDLVPEALIEDVAKEIEKDGTIEWAPAPNSPFYEHDEPPASDDDEPIPLEFYSDEPTGRYGSPEDLEARAHAREAIDDLFRALEPRPPVGIGHNQPPAEETGPDEIKELRPALIELATELARANPAIGLVKRWATPLRDALLASTKWGLKKIDTGIEAGIKAAAVGTVGWLATQYSEPLQKAFEAVVAWLDIVAKTLF